MNYHTGSVLKLHISGWSDLSEDSANVIHGVPFKTQPKNSRILQMQINRRVTDSPSLRRDTRVKITVVDGPLLATHDQLRYFGMHNLRRDMNLYNHYNEAAIRFW